MTDVKHRAAFAVAEPLVTKVLILLYVDAASRWSDCQWRLVL